MLYNKKYIAFVALASLLGGCAGGVTSEPMDYTAFEAYAPKSILVLPPVNQSVDETAPYVFLSQVTKPLAEQGYYVFPVAVVDHFMKQNGQYIAADMHAIPSSKLAKIFGADAVLYVSINDWGQKYQLIDSQTIVDFSARLVDAKTGVELWAGSKQMSQGGSDNDNDLGIAGMLVAALVNQVVNDVIDRSKDVAATANQQLFGSDVVGLLPGPYLPTVEPEE
jgi:hypothetical protein